MGGNPASPGTALSNRQHEYNVDAIGNRNWAGVKSVSTDRKNFTANALNQYSSRDNSFSPFSGTQSYGYDDDGNLLTDGQWQYPWEGENRLIAMQTDPAVIPPIASADARRLEFKYDYLGRRVEKLVRAGWNGPNYTTVVLQHRFIYDGWSLVAESAVSGSTLTVARSYWSEPVNVQIEQAEILCEGEIKILREIKMAGASEGTRTKLKRLF